MAAVLVDNWEVYFEDRFLVISGVWYSCSYQAGIANDNFFTMSLIWPAGWMATYLD